MNEMQKLVWKQDHTLTLKNVQQRKEGGPFGVTERKASEVNDRVQHTQKRRGNVE